MAKRRSIGPCAKKCKGKKQKAFQSCVRVCMRK